jgi:hypothetical protein
MTNDSKRLSEIEAIAERLESAAPAASLDDDDLLIAISEETYAILDEERDKHETWRGLLEWMDRRWPEDLFPALTDSPGRDTGPRLTSALRRLAEIRSLCDNVTFEDGTDADTLWPSQVLAILDGESTRNER